MTLSWRLAGEWLGRWLFFVSVVPKSIAAAFAAYPRPITGGPHELATDASAWTRSRRNTASPASGEHGLHIGEKDSGSVGAPPPAVTVRSDAGLRSA